MVGRALRDCRWRLEIVEMKNVKAAKSSGRPKAYEPSKKPKEQNSTFPFESTHSTNQPAKARTMSTNSNGNAAYQITRHITSISVNISRAPRRSFSSNLNDKLCGTRFRGLSRANAQCHGNPTHRIAPMPVPSSISRPEQWHMQSRNRLGAAPKRGDGPASLDEPGRPPLAAGAWPMKVWRPHEGGVCYTIWACKPVLSKSPALLNCFGVFISQSRAAAESFRRSPRCGTH
jgi:hypothetical protein